MSRAIDLLRRRATPLAALALVLPLYFLTHLPAPAPAEQAALAARFRFSRQALAEIPGRSPRPVRRVHPSLERISAWISSVGAGVALADLDGDGLPNDVCHVDPRTDTVTVAPAPGTASRFEPFPLSAAPLRYDDTMAPMGCLAGDLNEDGLMDLLVYYWGRTPIAFLRRLDEGRGRSAPLGAAAFRPQEVVRGQERWFTNAATLADLDGDGHADLVVGNYFQDGARILDTGAGGTEVMHDTKSKSYNGGRKHFLLWDGGSGGPQPAVRFRAADSGLDGPTLRGWTLAIAAADLDGDLRPELYLANDFGPDRLLRNHSTPGQLRFARLEGARTLGVPASFVLGHDSFKGMGVDFGDLNGDGVPDIYVSNIAAEFALQESHFLWLSTGPATRLRDGVAPYEQASERLGLSRSGWGWDCKLADFDNDGGLEALQATGFIKGHTNRWPELQALGTGNSSLMHDPRYWPRFRPGDDVSGRDTFAFFVRGGDGRFYDLGRDIGLTAPMVSRGVATADVDGDGRLDFAVANQWETSYFFHNQGPSPGAFLGLHLRLPLPDDSTLPLRWQPGHPGPNAPGRPAIGASATVRLPDGRRLTAQVDGGNGHSGKRSPDLHFGLGKVPDGTPLPVELRWRDGDGLVRQATIHATPGWHTVQLGRPAHGR